MPLTVQNFIPDHPLKTASQAFDVSVWFSHLVSALPKQEFQDSPLVATTIGIFKKVSPLITILDLVCTTYQSRIFERFPAWCSRLDDNLNDRPPWIRTALIVGGIAAACLFGGTFAFFPQLTAHPLPQTIQAVIDQENAASPLFSVAGTAFLSRTRFVASTIHLLNAGLKGLIAYEHGSPSKLLSAFSAIHPLLYHLQRQSFLTIKLYAEQGLHPQDAYQALSQNVTEKVTPRFIEFVQQIANDESAETMRLFLSKMREMRESLLADLQYDITKKIVPIIINGAYVGSRTVYDYTAYLASSKIPQLFSSSSEPLGRSFFVHAFARRWLLDRIQDVVFKGIFR